MLESGPLILKNERASLKIVYDFERVRGIEPLSAAWKAAVIPLYDTRFASPEWPYLPCRRAFARHSF